AAGQRRPPRGRRSLQARSTVLWPLLVVPGSVSHRSLIGDLGVMFYPIDQRFLVALVPGPALAILIQSPDLAVLIEDRLFRIHGDELKDLRQRLVFLNHAADEMDITF